jgi:hypothetical protein
MTHVGNRGGSNGGLWPHLGEAAVVESSPKGDSGSGLDLGRRRHHNGSFIRSYRGGSCLTGKRKTRIEGLGYTVQGLNGPNTLLSRIQSWPRRTGYMYPDLNNGSGYVLQAYPGRIRIRYAPDMGYASPWM